MCKVWFNFKIFNSPLLLNAYYKLYPKVDCGDYSFEVDYERLILSNCYNSAYQTMINKMSHLANFIVQNIVYYITQSLSPTCHDSYVFFKVKIAHPNWYRENRTWDPICLKRYRLIKCRISTWFSICLDWLIFKLMQDSLCK